MKKKSLIKAKDMPLGTGGANMAKEAILKRKKELQAELDKINKDL